MRTGSRKREHAYIINNNSEAQFQGPLPVDGTAGPIQLIDDQAQNE